MSAKVIANGCVTLFVKRLAGPFWIRRKWLAGTQWQSKQELEDIQLRLLKRLVRYAYKAVPYYRRLMDERGIKVESIKTLEDITLFPILTKNDAKEIGDSLFSSTYPRWLVRTTQTSGTTGTPFKLRRSLFSIQIEHAFARRQWDWAGAGLNDVCAYLKGTAIDDLATKRSGLYVYDPIMKELHLSIYHLSVKTAGDYAKVIKRFGAKTIVGWPSSVNILAKGCLDSGIDLELKAVLVTAEALSPATRDLAAKAFKCKVFDFYGAAERVSYIHTCEQGRYHVIPEYGLTEMIPVDDKSECCKLIATGFWNPAMPLIRYDTSDMVVPSDEECPCGRAFPVVKSVIGRECDVIRTASGDEFASALLGYLVYGVCGAEGFTESQIVQDALDHITIAYVPDKECSAERLSEFKRRLEKYLPNELTCSLKEVDAVQRAPSGKVKYLVSLIDG
jgi:phenylacetate-CoA ligase